MNSPAVSVSGLTKRYQIGADAERYLTLSDALARGMRQPLRWLNQLAGRGPAQTTFWALQGISFQVQPGEIVGVIGRNGAGKSTLLKVLSRITEPSEGRIEIRGRVSSLLEVGTGFHPELTGRENIFLNGAILGMSRQEVLGKFDEIVGFAEVSQFIDTPVKRYSSGMYLRLAFAVAAHLEPEVLLVDEVLAVGDVGFQEKCLGRMRAVATGGRTVFLVSHNMAAISALCTRVLWLDGGRLAHDGPTDSAVGAYLDHSLAASGGESGFASLEHRVDRPGDGSIRFTHVRLLAADGTQVSYFRSGQIARFAIGYRMADSAKVPTIKVGIVLMNSRQQPIASCLNDVSGDRFSSVPRTGEFLCEIPKLPLMPGRYVVNLGLRNGPAVADKVYEAIELNVAEGDFYPTKLLPPPAGGDALFDYCWTISESGSLTLSGACVGISEEQALDGQAAGRPLSSERT